jgi:two-component system, OmpR family, response regulator MprA
MLWTREVVYPLRETILVIDDDEKITSMLRRGLAFDGYNVLTAGDGLLGLKQLLEGDPGLIILDIMMPNVDGWEVCRRIRSSGSTVPILMLTAKDEVGDRVKGLDLGADDYLVKPFALEELLARVRALFRRRAEGGHEETNELKYEDITLNMDTREVYRGHQSVELTTKEFDLLHLFMQNPRRVLSRDLIMEKIWGYDFHGESNVLEVYVALLRQKTEEGGHKRLIQTVRGAGYVLRGES